MINKLKDIPAGEELDVVQQSRRSVQCMREVVYRAALAAKGVNKKQENPSLVKRDMT